MIDLWDVCIFNQANMTLVSHNINYEVKRFDTEYVMKCVPTP